MTDAREMQIEIGNEVKIKGEEGWFKVTDVTVEKVKTIHKGELTFIRVYFGMIAHRPVWDYEIESVRNAPEVD